jgi:hypothetical protein
VATQAPRSRKTRVPTARKFVSASMKIDVMTYQKIGAMATARGLSKSAWMLWWLKKGVAGVVVSGTGVDPDVPIESAA